MKNELKHTAHSSYRCEYHVVFAPKYRRKIIYKHGEYYSELYEILKEEFGDVQAIREYRGLLEEVFGRKVAQI